ncbi:MAG: rhomboid family intramembrane serine protease [Chitinophagaceae bacterium]
MGDRDYFKIEKKPLLGANNNALVWLIGINCIVTIILKMLSMIYQLSYDGNIIAEDKFVNDVLHWFTLSPNTHDLLSKPWSLFTYCITHYNFMQLFGNALWLWAFGYILQDLLGNKQIIPLYIYGSFFGAIVFVVTASYIPSLRANIGAIAPLQGANFGIMCIAIATTTYAPMYKLLPQVGNGIPLFILTLLYLAINFAYIAQTNIPFALGNLVAATLGFIFIKQLKNGNDIGHWMYQTVNVIDDWFNPQKKQQTKKQSERNFYNTTVPTFTKTPNITEAKTNEILDKISKVGYNNLSQEEKDFLNRISSS